VVLYLVPGWHIVRAALALTSYLLGVAALSLVWMLTPAHALVSATGWARVASASQMNAFNVASRSLISQAAGSAIAEAAGSSVAVRVATAGIGWTPLGIAAGLIIAQIVWDAAQTQAIKDAAAIPGEPVSVPGASDMTGQTVELHDPCVGSGGCGSTYDQTIDWRKVPPGFGGCTSAGFTLPAGWSAWGGHPAGDGSCRAFHFANSPSTKASPATASQPATAQSITDYIGGLPDGSGNSIPSNTDNVGAGVTPTPAGTVTTVTADSSQVASSVVPAANVQPSDTVLNPNATQPDGQIATPIPDTTTTTTTTTTTNPDGSVTQTQDTSGGAASCSSAEQDSRTFGSVLQAHMNIWTSSPLTSALSSISNLVWPSASPTYSLNSTLLGSFSFDFSAWNGILLALRSLIIAGAGFAAYRIIFIGGSSGGSD